MTAHPAGRYAITPPERDGPVADDTLKATKAEHGASIRNGGVEVFGRKVELSENSTMGGESLGQVGRARGMVLNPDPIPFIPSDGIVRSEPLGEMTGRCLGAGAAQALAATAGKRSADALARHAPGRSLHRSRDESLDARLARLGVRTAERDFERARWFTIVDMPLT